MFTIIQGIIYCILLLITFNFTAHAGLNEQSNENSYVRIIQADYKSKKNYISIGEKKIELKDFKTITQYFPLPFGKTNFSISNKNSLYNLQPGKNYSLIVAPKELILLEDGSLRFAGKSLLAFYNLTREKELTLKSIGKSINIIDATPSYKNKSRELHPTEKILGSIFDHNNKEIGRLEPFSLSKGEVRSIIVFENNFYDIEIVNFSSGQLIQ